MSVIYGGIGIIESFWLYSFVSETKELCRDGAKYLCDPWNYLDMSITILT
jgi:hypothetical protein